MFGWHYAAKGNYLEPSRSRFNHPGRRRGGETINSTNGCHGDFPSPQKVSHCHFSEHIKAGWGDGTPEQKTSQSTAEIQNQVLFHIQLVCLHTRMARLVLFLFSLGLAAAQPAKESRVISSGKRTQSMNYTFVLYVRVYAFRM